MSMKKSMKKMFCLIPICILCGSFIIEDIARKLHPMRFKPSFGFMNTL